MTEIQKALISILVGATVVLIVAVFFKGLFLIPKKNRLFNNSSWFTSFRGEDVVAWLVVVLGVDMYVFFVWLIYKFIF